MIILFYRICRRHTSLSPDSAAFWAFSWDEMAKYDLPAMIEFVVNATKQPKIFYAGHSQGSFYEFVIVKYVCRYELTMCILLSMQFTMAYATEMISFKCFISLH